MSIGIWLCVFLQLSAISSARKGFLSLDCGGTTSYEDANGITWKPDDEYITSGITASISSKHLESTSLKYLQTVRYFPDSSRKYCYRLPVVSNMTYLVRPRFYYGNFDGTESSTFEVDIMIDATLFVSGSMSADQVWYYEFIIRSSSESLDLCLAASSTAPTKAFISSIELRTLATGMYGPLDSTGALILLRRVNLGASSTDEVRYPNDKYDRIWRSDKEFSGMRNYTTISTSKTVSPAETPDQPPSAVMNTAITSNSTMIFEFPVTIANSECYFTFYFAEFQALGDATREFDLRLKNESSQVSLPVLDTPLSIERVSQGTPLSSVEVYALKPWRLQSPVFNFIPTVNSTLGPLVNAAELYLSKSELSLGTEPDDKTAISSIRDHFNLSGWSGDPCLPEPYAWDWITCNVSSTSARITELKLSSNELQGSIPEKINSLVHLTKIYMDNNRLTGSIPSLSSLKNLTVLHLQNNNLTGTFPRSLLAIQDLSLQNNTFDCVPKKLAASYSTSGVLVPTCTSKNKGSIGIIVGAVVAVVLLALGLVAVWFYKRKSTSTKPEKVGVAPTENPSLAPRSPNVSSRHFSYKEILQATNSFKKVLGEGSFGSVYYGRLSNGVEVAVKVLSSGSTQGEREFNTEVDILTVVHHKNLVFLLGSCTEGPKLMLVYEYLSNGTLRDHLYGSDKQMLSWRTRLNIALDAAQGLEYLHTSCNSHIIHRDVKTTNILLSSSMVAKVADFGLSRLMQRNEATHVSTIVKGTRGYLDPEYHSCGRLTEKSDVYSFGVVLFEIVCGREPVNLLLPDDEVVLAKWACRELDRGNLRTVVDPKLVTYSEQAAWKVLEVAMSCVEFDSKKRPSMSKVVGDLREAISLQEGSSTSFSDSLTKFTRAR